MSGPVGSGSYRFDAFISYASSGDYRLARDLEEFLERFHELPTPENTPLRRLQIWRDGSDASMHDIAALDIERMLETYLRDSHYLILLWSKDSRLSRWTQWELDWFLANREPSDILLALTDAIDPDNEASQLFVPAILDRGLHQRRWYDLRGFRSAELIGALKVRDYDEIRVQIASDLNGYSPGLIQPIWWRNKLREQQERAEEEERARRRIEIAECDARLEAARGWYERALVFVREARPLVACKCLLNGLALSPPGRVPAHYPRTSTRPGWSEESWALLRYVSASAPRVLRRSALKGGTSGYRRWRFGEGAPGCRFIGDGSMVAALVGETAIDILDAEGSRRTSIVVGSREDEISYWAAARNQPWIAAGTSSGELLLWRDGATSRVKGHDEVITGIAFSADAYRLVTGSRNGDFRVWRISDDGRLTLDGSASIKNDREECAVISLSLVDDPPRIVGLVGVSAFVHDLATGEHRALADIVQSEVAVSASGAQCAYAVEDVIHTVALAGAGDKMLYVGQHKGFVKGIEYSGDDAYLISQDISGPAVVWRADEGKLERGHAIGGMLITTTFDRANRGTYLKTIEALAGVDEFVTHPAFPNVLLTRRDDVLETWSLGFMAEPQIGWSVGYKGSVMAAWVPDEQSIVAAAEGRVLLLEDGKEPHELFTLGAQIGDVAVAETGLIATVCANGKVVIWSRSENRQIAEATFAGQPYSARFGLQESELVVGCSDGTLWIWNWSSQKRRRLGAMGDTVRSLATSADRRLLAVSCENGAVSVWDLSEELELVRDEADFLRPAVRVAISPSGRFVAAAHLDGALRCWETASGQMISSTSLPPTVPNKPDQVTAVAFADDDCTAIAGLWDGTLCLVDVIRGRELARFQGHTKVITSISQGPRTGLVITTSIDIHPANQHVRVWSLFDRELLPIEELRAAEWVPGARERFARIHGSVPRDFEETLALAEFDGTRPDMTSEEQDDEVARLFALLRADPRSPEIAVQLASAYLNRGDEDRARDLFLRVYRQDRADLINDPRAEFLVGGALLEEGDQDALGWIRRSSEHGFADADGQLGLLYLRGHLVDRDIAQGKRLLERSANAGSTHAAFHLGNHFEHEERGMLAVVNWRQVAFGSSAGARPSDCMRTAFDWYRRAAEGDLAVAQTRMGDFYVKGEVVPVDLDAARHWYKRAAENGDESARDKLANLRMEGGG